MSSAESLIEKGDYEGALALLREQTSGPQPDPGQLLTTFNMQVRLQRFADAEASMRRLLEIAPQVAQPMGVFARNARAEAIATARLTDPAVAGKRSAMGLPPPYALAYVKAAVLHAQKDYAGAAAAIAEAKGLAPATPGTLTYADGRTARFVTMTDSDDLTGQNLPCYDGDKLLDLPYSQLQSVTFLDARTSFDVMWAPSEVVSADGKAALLKVPTFYTGTGKADEPMLRTGQETMWDRAHGYALGIGQRDFNVSMQDGGTSLVGALRILKIEFDPQPKAASEKKSFWKRLFG